MLASRAHWEIIRLVRSKGFQPDCRWIAAQSGLELEEINIALSRLPRLRLLEIRGPGVWKTPELAKADEAGFKRVALARVREQAARHCPTRGLNLKN